MSQDSPAAPGRGAAPLVALERVTVVQGLRRVVDRVDLRLDAGQVVALVGPGGCGKTQLIKTLATLHPPLLGRVTVCGVRVRRGGLSRHPEVRRAIGMQFQNFALFDSLTVLENVAFPMVAGGRGRDAGVREAADAEARSLLARVGLQGTEALLPGALSGGMKRRVAVARALVTRPRIALFDDPTAGLDPVNSARILDLLTTEAVGPDRVVVVAGHDLDRLLPLCTHVAVMREGRLGFFGTVREGLLAPDPWVRAFLGQEATGDAVD